MINKTFPPPIGRIQKSSGTTIGHPDIRNGILAVMQKCQQKGLFKLLVELRDGQVSPLHLYALDLDGKLESTTTSLQSRPIDDVNVYLTDTRSGHLTKPTKRGYRACLKLFFSYVSNAKSKSVSDIPTELLAMRKKLTSVAKSDDEPTKYRTFNQLRSLCQSYFTNTPGFGAMCPLWIEVTNIKKLQAKSRQIAALTVPQVHALADKLADDHFRGILWNVGVRLWDAAG